MELVTSRPRILFLVIRNFQLLDSKGCLGHSRRPLSRWPRPPFVDHPLRIASRLFPLIPDVHLLDGKGRPQGPFCSVISDIH